MGAVMLLYINEENNDNYNKRRILSSVAKKIVNL